MNNVMRTGNRGTHTQRGFCIGLACAVIFVIMVLVCAAPSGLVYLYFENEGMTREAEDNLTRLHGAEVTSAIERFERTWFSLNAYRNPAIQGEVATAWLIQSWGVERVSNADDTDWRVTASASVIATRVREFDPAHFKAAACVNFERARLSKDGVTFEREPPQIQQRFYVFVREGESWKAATLFDITDFYAARRAWEGEIPEWEKQMIGEFPGGIYPGCWEPMPVSP